MESIEVWHAEQLPAGDLLASARELDGALGYPLTALRLARRRCLTDDSPLDWTRATGVLDGAATYVPTAALRLDSTVDERWAPPMFDVTSNGLASGRTHADAVLHGLYELAERDALARAGAARNRLDLSWSTGDVADLADRFARAGVALTVELVPSELGVACVEARASSEEFPVDFIGTAAHADPEVAMVKAIAEVAQARVAAIAGTREDLTGALFTGEWTPQEPLAVEGDWPPPGLGREPRDPADGIADLATRIAEHTGFAPLVVDHTRAELKVPVVRVVCPGLTCPADY
jgi:ribosomal protein S12 methylthiotransferase accessory factor